MSRPIASRKAPDPLRNPCPTCHRRSGYRCVNKHGAIVPTHGARVALVIDEHGDPR